MPNPNGNVGLLRKKCSHQWDPPDRCGEWYCIRWVTDEDILLTDGPFASRYRARVAMREKMRETGFPCYVFKHVYELCK